MSDRTKADRRAAIDAYKERKADWCLVAIRIGQAIWVKVVADPAAFERRMSFTLRTGSAPLPAMGAAYRESPDVSVKVLERLDEDLSDMARDTMIKARLKYWMAELGAGRF
ncbi:hypothetical protein [Maritimibacter sp. DP1N21-5]|uniref:hypothetical protein n=1 Tax=Maritimibacter sp. DP1N21-5 TaxID=2836867 RepID=UPI001C44E5EC|nr:hypothetical protein [Maritimibacter sp. DP1N21-5]MBV7409582.1 hypothetical protein [Maritimibacter sp. DP1N21-5]